MSLVIAIHRPAVLNDQSNLYIRMLITVRNLVAALALCFGIASLPSQAQIVIPLANDIATLGGNGTAGFTGDGGLATSAEIHSPYALVLDNVGNIYFADQANNRVRKVTAATG